jgi:hypothetical protein
MNNLAEFAAHLAKTWGTKTLAAFRNEASKELNGTAFESVRADEGQRLAIIICLTGEHQISLLEDSLHLGEQVAPADWSSLTLADMAMRTVLRDGLTCEDLRDENGERSAVVLSAADPDSVRILETLFNLPR